MQTATESPQDPSGFADEAHRWWFPGDLKDRQPQPPWLQLSTLCKMEILNWRWSWRPLVITGFVFPVMLVTLLGFLAGDDASQEQLAYILCGNVVVTLIFTNMHRMSSCFAWMKAVGTLDYYATLPIHSYVVVMAVLFSFFVLSLPAILATMAYGFLLLDLPIRMHPLLIIVIPMAALSLAGLGAYIGVASRSLEEAQSFSRLVLAFVVVLGPVLIPPSNLPDVMFYIGRLSPATYGVSALQQTLLGPVSAAVGLDLIVLSGFAVIFLVLVHRKMRWRQEVS